MEQLWICTECNDILTKQQSSIKTQHSARIILFNVYKYCKQTNNCWQATSTRECNLKKYDIKTIIDREKSKTANKNLKLKIVMLQTQSEGEKKIKIQS